MENKQVYIENAEPKLLVGQVSFYGKTPSRQTAKGQQLHIATGHATIGHLVTGKR